MGRFATFAWLLVAGASCSACHRVEVDRPDVMLVVIDTLRKDHVTTYGYERDTTPNIDRWAERALVFDDAVAQSSWTLPSLASLMTSVHPPEIEQAPGKLHSLSDQTLTVAEVLRDAGYRTISVTTNPYNADQIRLMQGFQQQDWRISAPADWVVDQAIARIDAARADAETAGQPIFLYLHFMDVHEPRRPPPPYDNYFPALDGLPNQPLHQEDLRFTSGEDLDSDEFRVYRSHVISVYDGALRFVDAQFGRLLAHEDAAGGLENWIVVLTSDHGEEFWEHAELEREFGLAARPNVYGIGHGQSVFRELINVPLVFGGPGIPAQRVDRQVRLLDVVPTLLGFARVDASKYDLEGVDLASMPAPDPPRHRAALSEVWTDGLAQQSFRDEHLQLVRAGSRELLFDRQLGAFVPLAEHPADVARLREGLAQRLAGLRRVRTAPLVLEPDLVERLRALGYAQ